MAKMKNHITNSDDYQRYLAGQMSARERHDFEKHLLEDDFENEAFEGISQLDPDEFGADMDQLKSQFHDRSKNKNTYTYWRIAAAVLLLGLFSFVIYYMVDINTTKEITQVKEGQELEEPGNMSSQAIPDSDSAEIEPDRIIAFQQEITEEQSEKEPVQSIEKKSIPESSKEPALIDEPPAEAFDMAIADTYDEEEIQIQAEQSAELPAINQAERLNIQAETEPIARKKEAVTEELMAPSTAKSPGRRAARINDDIRTITGRVLSQEDDEPIPGVNVIMKGSAVGTITNMDGNYSIDIPKDKDAILVYSYIGLQTEEVMVKEDDRINVALEPDMKQLTEVVVTDVGSKSDKDKQPYSYTPPKPEGGNNAFRDYVKENIRYPSSALKDKIRGTVKLKFGVGTHGDLSNIEVVKSLGEDFDREAIRLLQEGPKWEPAIENDSAVVKDVTVKIRFKPPE